MLNKAWRAGVALFNVVHTGFKTAKKPLVMEVRRCREPGSPELGKEKPELSFSLGGWRLRDLIVLFAKHSHSVP